MYDLETGKPLLNGKRKIRRGPAGPPCRNDATACPKGAPGKSELTVQNAQVLQHYMECRAVGQFPDDPLVRQNAALLHQVFEAVQQHRMAVALRGAVGSIVSLLFRR